MQQSTICKTYDASVCNLFAILSSVYVFTTQRQGMSPCGRGLVCFVFCYMPSCASCSPVLVLWSILRVTNGTLSPLSAWLQFNCSNECKITNWSFRRIYPTFHSVLYCTVLHSTDQSTLSLFACSCWVLLVYELEQSETIRKKGYQFCHGGQSVLSIYFVTQWMSISLPMVSQH